MSDLRYSTMEALQYPDLNLNPFGTETSFFLDNNFFKTEIKVEPTLEEFCSTNIQDNALFDIAKTAEETGSLMPLLKEELRCKIQAKRLAAGQSELNVCAEKPKMNQLTDDDIRRRETRKEQNRRAAKRYRIKQRDLLSNDKEEKQRLEQENACLRSEMIKLREDNKSLENIILQHQRCTCVSSREAVVPEWQHDTAFFMN